MTKGDVEQMIIRCRNLTRDIEDDGVMLGQSLRGDVMNAYQDVLRQEKELIQNVEQHLNLTI